MQIFFETENHLPLLQVIFGNYVSVLLGFPSFELLSSTISTMSPISHSSTWQIFISVSILRDSFLPSFEIVLVLIPAATHIAQVRQL